MRGQRRQVAERVRELLGVTSDAAEPAAGDRHGWRWDPGRRAVIAVMLAVLVVVAVTVWWWATSSTTDPVPVTADGPPPVSLSMAASPGATAPAAVTPSVAASPASIVVDVDGKVARPGIYRLPAGSRVYDAIEAAGGAVHGVDTVTINLAAPVQDGQQVVVGVSGAATPGPGDPAASSAAPSVVNLNSATAEQLDTLPGVGPVLAQHILDWRAQHGRFDTVDQLDEVSGIGDVTFAELKDLVTV